MKYAKRLAFATLFLLGIAHRAQADLTQSGNLSLTAGGNDTLPGTGRSFANYIWTGDGTLLNMANYYIQNIVDTNGFTLDLAGGSITNGGTIGTTRALGTGSIVITNVSNLTSTNGISTVCQDNNQSKYFVGSVSLTGQDSGSLSVGPAGVQAYYTRSGGTGARAGSISIQGFNSVTIGGSVGTWAGNQQAGSILIGAPAHPIGGAIAISGDIAAFTGTDTSAKGAPISLCANGSISVRNITSGVSRGRDASAAACDITIVSRGAFTCGSITSGVDRGAVLATNRFDGTDSSGAFTSGPIYVQRSCYQGGAGSPVSISNYSAVAINGDVRADVWSCYSGPWKGGNLTVTNITGNIAIAGTINLSGNRENTSYAVPTHGTLSLTTTGGAITLANLDMSKVNVAAFSFSTTGTIGSALSSFVTNWSSGSGTVASPYLTTQKVLRVSSGKSLYYDATVATNAYLAGMTYQVADLSGTAGAGGLLTPMLVDLGAGPIIASSAATNITKTTTYLNGSLSSTGASATAVSVLWGPGSDQGTNTPSTTAPWAYTNFFGTNVVTVPPSLGYSTNVSGLLAGSNYTYRYYAVNSGGASWGAAQSFTTYIEPLVTNGAANVVGPTKVWLQGTVTRGVPAPQAYFCLDLTDKGTASTGDWIRVIAVAGTPSGAFSNLVSGLAPNTSYSYRCYVTNAVGAAWAPTAATFSTPDRNTVFCLISNQDRTDGQALTGTSGPGGPAATVDDIGSGLFYDFSAYLGFDMGGYYLMNTADTNSLTLDLAGGSITNGGLIGTTRSATTGNLAITNVSSFASTNGISTVCQDNNQSGYTAGSVSLIGQANGSLSIGPSGVQAFYTRSGASGMGGAVSIQRFNGVAIGGSIGTWAGNNQGGAISIGTSANPIGGAIAVSGDIAAFTNMVPTADQNAKGAPIGLYANGPISVGNLQSVICRENPQGAVAAADITAVGKGAFTAGAITAGLDYNAPLTTVRIDGTDSSGAFLSGTIDVHRTCYKGGAGTQVAISNFSSVAINGDVRANVSLCYQGPWTGGSLTVSNITGDITIHGSVDLRGKAESGYGTATNGNLSLTTSGGAITLTDLDMSKVSVASFGFGTTGAVTNNLVGFATNWVSGNGKAVNPYVTTQQMLRVPAGKCLYYSTVAATNAYLAERFYRVADLSGAAGLGGLLAPLPGKPKGTLVCFW
jgi:hypothetical protein